MNKIKVIISGNVENEHSTYIEHDGKYFYFHTNGWDGVSSQEIVSLLKFLGYEVFEIHRAITYTPLGYIVKVNESSV